MGSNPRRMEGGREAQSRLVLAFEETGTPVPWAGMAESTCGKEGPAPRVGARGRGEGGSSGTPRGLRDKHWSPRSLSPPVSSPDCSLLGQTEVAVSCSARSLSFSHVGVSPRERPPDVIFVGSENGMKGGTSRMLLFLSKFFPSLAAIQHSLFPPLPHPCSGSWKWSGGGEGKCGNPHCTFVLRSGRHGAWGVGRGWRDGVSPGGRGQETAEPTAGHNYRSALPLPVIVVSGSRRVLEICWHSRDLGWSCIFQLEQLAQHPFLVGGQGRSLKLQRRLPGLPSELNELSCTQRAWALGKSSGAADR